MSLAVTRAVSVEGIVGSLVEVECRIAPGLPGFTIIGLPDTACAQAPARVRSAAIAAEHSLNQSQVMINLSPASLPKHGTSFDLAFITI